VVAAVAISPSIRSDRTKRRCIPPTCSSRSPSGWSGPRRGGERLGSCSRACGEAPAWLALEDSERRWRSGCARRRHGGRAAGLVHIFSFLSPIPGLIPSPPLTSPNDSTKICTRCCVCARFTA
jgi:hypothetical protein